MSTTILTIVTVGALTFAIGMLLGTLLSAGGQSRNAGLLLLNTFFDFVLQPLRTHPNTSEAASVRDSLTFTVRKIVRSRDPARFVTEADAEYVYGQTSVSLAHTALLLIDVWDTSDEPNDGYRDRNEQNVKSKMIPLVDAFRHGGGRIVHAPHKFKIHPSVLPHKKDLVINQDNRVPMNMRTLLAFLYLKFHRIDTLIVAGYETHKCIFERPLGFYHAHGLFKSMVLVRDCTLAFEFSNPAEGEPCRFTFTSIIEEAYGASTELKDLVAGFEARKNAGLEAD